jgi:hypothetical protein
MASQRWNPNWGLRSWWDTNLYGPRNSDTRSIKGLMINIGNWSSRRKTATLSISDYHKIKFQPPGSNYLSYKKAKCSAEQQNHKHLKTYWNNNLIKYKINSKSSGFTVELLTLQSISTNTIFQISLKTDYLFKLYSINVAAAVPEIHRPHVLT